MLILNQAKVVGEKMRESQKNLKSFGFSRGLIGWSRSAPPGKERISSEKQGTPKSGRSQAPKALGSKSSCAPAAPAATRKTGDAPATSATPPRQAQTAR